MWTSGDPRKQMNCRPGCVRVNGDVLHEGSHQGDAAAAMAVRSRLGRFPRAGVNNGQLHLVDQSGRAQSNDALRTVSMTVLDGVSDGFPGRNEHVMSLIWIHPGLG